MSQHSLSTAAERAVEAAQHFAAFNRHAQVDSSHLLYGLLFTSVVSPLTLAKVNIASSEQCQARLETAIQAWVAERPSFAAPSLAYMRAMQFADKLAANTNSDAIYPEHLLVAVVEVDPRLREFLGLGPTAPSHSPLLATSNAHQPTPTLDRLGRDLTRLAAAGQLAPVIGREKDIEQIIEVLLRRGKNSVLLTGPAGVGKTAVVERLAQDIVSGAVPAKLANTRLIELSAASLMAGTSYRGDLETRVQAVVNEASASQAVILVIDEFHAIVGAGNTRDGGADIANIIKPALARGEMTCIGITTSDEYVRYVEQDAALARRFQLVEVHELSGQDTLAVLTGIQAGYVQHHHVNLAPDALDAIVTLCARFVTNRRFPDKAVDVLGKAFSRAELRKLPQVDRALVAEIIGEMAGLPVGQLDEKTRHNLSTLEADLGRRVIGQPEAIAAVARAVRLAYMDLRDPGKPIGVFLFVGPSGVGKTELVKALAETLFGADSAMVRLDMSEYAEKISLTRLIGAPPGYVGYEQAGQLSQALRDHPHSIVLLDEVEKAHPEVFDVFLQLFDEGRLTDAQGRSVDGRQAIFVMTSNLLVEFKASHGLGFVPKSSESELVLDDSAVREFFRPELLNRLTSIVRFNQLALDDYVEIADLELRRLAQRIEASGYKLTYEATTAEYIAGEVLRRQDSARGIARLLEEHVAEPVSEYILRNQEQGKRWVHVRHELGQIHLEWL